MEDPTRIEWLGEEGKKRRRCGRERKGREEQKIDKEGIDQRRGKGRKRRIDGRGEGRRNRRKEE